MSVSFLQRMPPLEALADVANPTSIRMDPKVRKALDKAAADDSRSLNNMIEKILTDWLRERGYLPKP